MDRSGACYFALAPPLAWWLATTRWRWRYVADALGAILDVKGPFQAVIERLRGLGANSVSTLDGIVERVTFPLPKGLAVTA